MTASSLFLHAWRLLLFVCFSVCAAVFVLEIGLGKAPTLNTHMPDYAKKNRIRINILVLKC